MKRPTLRLIGVPECDGENESKVENTSGYYPGELPQPSNLATNIQVQEIQRTTQRYSSRRAIPRNIIIRFSRVEIKKNAKGNQRERPGTHKEKPIRLTVDLSAETLQDRGEWGPIFNIFKKKTFNPEFHIQPN